MIWTDHAVDRAFERGVSVHEVEERVENAPWMRDFNNPENRLCWTVHNRQLIRIVYSITDEDDILIITVHKEHKK